MSELKKAMSLTAIGTAITALVDRFRYRNGRPDQDLSPVGDGPGENAPVPRTPEATTIATASSAADPLGTDTVATNTVATDN